MVTAFTGHRHDQHCYMRAIRPNTRVRRNHVRTVISPAARQSTLAISLIRLSHRSPSPVAVSPEQRHASHEDDAEGGGLVELKAAVEEDGNSIER